MGLIKNIAGASALTILALVFLAQIGSDKKQANDTQGSEKTEAPQTALKSETDPSPPPKVEPSKPYRAEIDQYAWQPIPATEKKLFKAWGRAGIARIDAATKGAAEAASKSESCDRVSVTGLDFDRSNPPDQIAVFASCANGQRFNLTEKEAISSSATAISISDSLKSMSDSDAISQCADLTKSQLQYPSTMDIAWFDSSVVREQMGANVTLLFEAKNGFGALLPHVAYCTIDDKKVHLNSVKPR